MPEAATMLMQSGAMIQNKKLSEEQSFNFQVQLMNAQLALEDIIYNIAKNT